MKKLIVLTAFLMIASNCLSQNGLNATSKDTMQCYTPTQARVMLKGLTEVEICREQLKSLRLAVDKQQEMHTQTAIDLEASEQNVQDLTKQNTRLKKNRKWWFTTGAGIGAFLVLLIL